jgi:hypothetical protein
MDPKEVTGTFTSGTKGKAKRGLEHRAYIRSISSTAWHWWLTDTEERYAIIHFEIALGVGSVLLVSLGGIYEVSSENNR